MDINSIILKILDKRGVKGDKNICEFLSPKPLITYDPFLLSGITEGVDLILSAIESKKKICVYGDYDVDGITSVSVLKTVLETLSGEEIMYYIPSRFDEGYGLNISAIDKIKNRGAELIITVDCGISSFDEVEYAKEAGLDIIITDHHSISGKIPDCIVINPKQSKCKYPFKELAGCGVAFKLAQGLQRKAGLSKMMINDLLDIVSIGTLADIVSLTDENRTIVKYGIDRIKLGKRKGLKYLIDTAVKGELTSEALSYNVIPSINAAGRIKEASIGVEFFTEKDGKKAVETARELVELNGIRKTVQEQDYEKCKTIYEKQYKEKRFPMIILQGGHEGVAGIVAGKMKEYCSKPVAILTETDGMYKGTSRSVESIDIYKLLAKHSELFEKFGGHKGACGFTVSLQNLKILSDEVEKDLLNIQTEEQRENIIPDVKITTDDISASLIEDLALLEPFGCDNERPVFLVENCLIEHLSYMGAEGQHIRGKIKGAKEEISFVYFNVPAEHMEKFNTEKQIDIVGTLGFNVWCGKKSIQLTVADIR